MSRCPQIDKAFSTGALSYSEGAVIVKALEATLDAIQLEDSAPRESEPDVSAETSQQREPGTTFPQMAI